MGQQMKISLLHATRGTPDRANATRESWLSRASDRSMIEHFWAIQAGDTTSTALDPDSIVAVTDDPPAWASSSIANWNAAAALATGDLLVVIADDLTPPIGWDDTLRVFLGNPNTASTQFCVYVADQLSNDGLLRHPIMSRALYQRRGFMFDPNYYGVFCDQRPNHMVSGQPGSGLSHRPAAPAILPRPRHDRQLGNGAAKSERSIRLGLRDLHGKVGRDHAAEGRADALRLDRSARVRGVS
jgi:hypothetical protein